MRNLRLSVHPIPKNSRPSSNRSQPPQNNSKPLWKQPPDISTLASRIEALEKAQLTEAKVKELATAEAKTVVVDYVASDDGKKAIGAEASRVAMAALGSAGTMPAKPTPASTEPDAKSLISAGKFEEAYAASTELQAQFPDAANYAAFAAAQAAGKVRILTK